MPRSPTRTRGGLPTCRPTKRAAAAIAAAQRGSARPRRREERLACSRVLHRDVPPVSPSTLVIGAGPLMNAARGIQSNQTCRRAISYSLSAWPWSPRVPRWLGLTTGAWRLVVRRTIDPARVVSGHSAEPRGAEEHALLHRRVVRIPQPLVGRRALAEGGSEGWTITRWRQLRVSPFRRLDIRQAGLVAERTRPAAARRTTARPSGPEVAGRRALRVWKLWLGAGGPLVPEHGLLESDRQCRR